MDSLVEAANGSNLEAKNSVQLEVSKVSHIILLKDILEGGAHIYTTIRSVMRHKVKLVNFCRLSNKIPKVSLILTTATMAELEAELEAGVN